MPVFIPVDIMKDVVELVMRNCLGSAGPGDMDLEDLQGWLLNFGDHSKKLRISVEYFVDWISNYNITWATYRSFMPGLLVVLDKIPIVRPVRIGETWH